VAIGIKRILKTEYPNKKWRSLIKNGGNPVLGGSIIFLMINIKNKKQEKAFLDDGV